MEAVVSGGDLVMGCGAVSSPPQFTQSSSNDAEIIDPLSGKCSVIVFLYICLPTYLFVFCLCLVVWRLL